MVARLAAYREAQEMGAERRLLHVVASPPQERAYSERALFATRTDAYDALEAAGVRGGSVVTHPYRTSERGDMLFEAAARAGDLDEDTGKWRFLREATEGWGDLTRYIEASPHYHALAAAEDVDGSEAPEGWVVERIRTFQAFHYRDSEAYRDMARTAYYVLTHGAAVDGRATTTYFGDLAPASFNPEEALTAARWDTIQREAEKAVKAPQEEESEGPGSGREECPHDGCESHVRPLGELPAALDDDDWRAGVPRDRLARLRGALVHFEGRADRPPPSAATSTARMREWLKELGEGHTPSPTQAQLPSEVFGSAGRGRAGY